MKFNLSGTAMCAECGQWLSSSGEDHDCIDSDKVEHLFKQIGSDKTLIIESATPNGAWRHLAQQVDNPVPWAYYGRVRVNHSRPVEVSASYYQRTGQDLREL